MGVPLGFDHHERTFTLPAGSVHPAFWDSDKLLAECRVERLRRRGPGGQHRNKVETGIRLTHLPTGLVAEASERRSQSENEQKAVWRLRLKLALHVRRVQTEEPPHPAWARHLQAGKIRLSEEHDDFPALLADLLDRLHWTEGDVHPVAQSLGCTVSQVVALLRKEPEALRLLNMWRTQGGKPPLR